MAAAVSGQIYQVTISSTLNSQRIMSSFTYELENVPAGGSTTKQACDAIKDFFIGGTGIIPLYQDCVPQNMTLNELWVQVIGPTERYVKEVYNLSVDGLWPSDALTSNVAAVITRTTEKSGRSQVAPLHLPCATDPDSIFQGSLDSDLLVAMALLCAKIPVQIGVVPNLTFDPVIYHGPPPKLPADRVERAVAQSTVRVMRRRTVGLGI